MVRKWEMGFRRIPGRRLESQASQQIPNCNVWVTHGCVNKVRGEHIWGRFTAANARLQCSGSTVRHVREVNLDSEN
jgi:hypothetical protein